MFTFVRQMFRGFMLVTLCVIAIPLAIFVCVMGSFIFLPLPAHLPEPKQSLASQPSHIYDINGKEIATLQRFDQNVPVQESDIPTVLKQALISSEDRNFYKNKGVDPKGTLRALWADLRNKQTVQGGSTITQQYVKLAYTGNERTVTRKIKEAVLAGELDRQMPKDEILYRYLSIVYFGDGAYGVGAASETYFHKPVNQLTASEAATLVGVIPAPSAWAPRENPDEAESRRKTVLQEMFSQGYLTKPQLDAAVSQSIVLQSAMKTQDPSTATEIFAPTSSQSQYPYFVDYVTKYLELKYGSDAVYSGGLRVQTTLSPQLEDEANQALANALQGTSPPLDMALVSIDPQTGFVKALVGGRNFNSSQVNLALGGCPSTPVYGSGSAKAGQKMPEQVVPSCRADPVPTSGGTGRQPGSSFKPFVLASAYEVGIKPSTVYPAPSAWQIPGCAGSGCVVHNDEGEVYGSVDLKTALAHSVNTVYAPLIRDIGTKEDGKVVDGFIHTANLAKRMGLTSAYYVQDFHGVGGQYALGEIDVSPLDMASAYGVFANRGIRVPPTPVVKIEDATGKVIEDNTNRQGTRVLDQTVSDNVVDAMRAVVQEGTGVAAQGVGRPVAGKTGTSENFTNAWFVGYTPTLSTAVWLGDSDAPRRINYKGNTSIVGGSIPAATWTAYMKQAMNGVPITDFSQPAPIQAPVQDVLSQNSGATTTLPIAPQTSRPIVTTPTGNFDKTNTQSPSVAAPTTVTVPLSTTPTSQLQPLGAPAILPDPREEMIR